MSLEDRIRQSVDAALEELRARLDAEVRTAVQQVEASAAEARTAVLQAACDAARAEVRAAAAAQAAAAERSAQAALEAAVAAAREDERTAGAADIRRIVESEAAQRLDAERTAAEHRLRLSLSDADQRAADALRESVTAATAREREAEMAGLTRLLDSIRGLDGATSLSEVLDVLGEAAGHEAARAAVLVLKGDRVVGWRLSGFGPRDQQPKRIDLPIASAGVVGLAVGAARTVTSRDSETANDGPGFTHLPEDRTGLAVPVIVGGRVVAVVYGDAVRGDDQDTSVPSGWPELLEILARHAARCLEALTAQRTGAGPAARFWVPPAGAPARSAHSPTGTAPAQPTPTPGSPGSVMTRAGDGLDALTRRAYDSRMPASLQMYADRLQLHVADTLAGGDHTLLGSPV